MATAQCPTPPTYDARLLVTPCAFQPATDEPGDPLAIVITTQNNQCARAIRQTLIELQRVTKEHQAHAQPNPRQ